MLFFSQFLHSPASWLSFKFLLQAHILLCCKKITGLCQVLRKSLIVIYHYSAKKYYFIFPLCSPVCLTVWLYLLFLSVAFRAHIQVFSVSLYHFSMDTYPPAEKPDPGNAEPAAVDDVWLKIFAVLIPRFFWRVLGVCIFPLHCFLLNLIFFF